MRASCSARSSSSTATRSRTRPRAPRPYGSPWTPEVALIDIGLPEVDGYEVARRIRKRLGGAVRLIALTGYGDAEARRLAAEAGFDEHLVKPVDPDTLGDLLRAS